MTKAYDFLEFAERDLLRARRALSIEIPDLHDGSQHVQQAAEKGIKALLTQEAVPFRKVHTIGALAALLPQNHALRSEAALFDSLSPLNEAGRYPSIGNAPPPSVLSEPELRSKLDELFRFMTRVARSLPRPRTAFVRALMAERPERLGYRNTASLLVTRRMLYDALSNAPSVSVEARALSALSPAARQVGYTRINGVLKGTGATHIERAALEHLYERMSKRPAEKSAFLTFDALAADEIVKKQIGLRRCLKALLDKSKELSKAPDVPQR